MPKETVKGIILEQLAIISVPLPMTSIVLNNSAGSKASNDQPNISQLTDF